MLKISNINKKYILPLITAGTLGFSSCQSQYSKAKEYCLNNDKTQKEFLELINSDKRIQSKIDSMVYRDLFNQTHLANDTQAVSDFNKIATIYNVDRKNFLPDIVENGISAKAYNEITLETNPDKRQYVADKNAYGDFFKKQGLMDKDFTEKFETASNFLSPSMNYTYEKIEADLK